MARIFKNLRSLSPERRQYLIKQLPKHLATSRSFDELAALLTWLEFLETKAEDGWVFELAQDLAEASRIVPSEHPRNAWLKLISEAIRLDIHFIARHPQTLFQCLWNSCSWDSCPQTRVPEPRDGLPRQVDYWRTEKGQAAPGFPWVRSLRPPVYRLGGAATGVMSGHRDLVRAVTFSPIGQYIGSAGNDALVHVWDSLSGKLVCCFEGHGKPVTNLVFLHDGRHVVSVADDCSMRIWDIERRTQRTKLRLKGDFRSVGLCKDDRVWVGGSPGLQRWTLDGELVEEITPSDARHFLLGSFSVDGEYVASEHVSESRRGFCIWVRNAITGDAIATLEGHDDSVPAIAFSSSRMQLVSGSTDQTVRIWELASGKEIACCRGHEGAVWSVAFSPDGEYIASGGDDATVRIWNARDGKALACLRGHVGEVWSVAFSPDGKQVASGSKDLTVRTWNWQKVSDSPRTADHLHPISGISISPDGTRLVSTAKGESQALVWDVETGTVVRKIEAGSPILRATFSPNGQFLALASLDGCVSTWDHDGNNLRKLVSGHRVIEDLGIAIANDSMTLATWGDWNDGQVRAWCIETGDARFSYDKVYARTAVFSPDGKLLVVSFRDGSVYVCDANTGKRIATLRCPREEVGAQSLAVSPDNGLAAAGYQWRIVLWDIKKEEQRFVLERSDGDVRQLAFSQDGAKLFATCDDGMLQEWDVRERTAPRLLRGSTDVTGMVQRHPWIALSGSSETSIVDSRNGEPVAWFPATPSSWVAASAGRSWAGSWERHLFLFRLEGDVPRPIASGPSQGKLDPLLRKVVEALRSQPRHQRHGEAAGGVSWQSDNYATHEAICPVCGVGNRFGSGDYTTELRVYFQDGDPKSLHRPIDKIRIKCGGKPVSQQDCDSRICTVGTGDSSGLYLLPHTSQSWNRNVVKLYLQLLDSPLLHSSSLEDIPDSQRD